MGSHRLPVRSFWHVLDSKVCQALNGVCYRLDALLQHSSHHDASVILHSSQVWEKASALKYCCAQELVKLPVASGVIGRISPRRPCSLRLCTSGHPSATSVVNTAGRPALHRASSSARACGQRCTDDGGVASLVDARDGQANQCIVVSCGCARLAINSSDQAAVASDGLL